MFIVLNYSCNIGICLVLSVTVHSIVVIDLCTMLLFLDIYWCLIFYCLCNVQVCLYWTWC